MSGKDLELPLSIDSFTLDRRIGAGAMGEVYHANEAISGREVAIKVMAGHLMGNRRAEARFRREIAAMGQLRHAGIPAFAGWGELPGGRPYLAMEYVPGHQLDAFISPGHPLPENLGLWVAQQLAEVIGHCHRESGMIHRDLKPGNIMVDLAGLPGLCEHSRIRILDFGLATYIDFGDFDDFSDAAHGYAAGGTVTGEVLGTPAYMSPEQIRGETLTFHSDIYAIGAILHHLLTGRLPYEGSSAGVVMAHHLTAPVPDPSLIAAVRPATVGVVQRAMAKSPQSRFRSYQQFVAALQAARYATGQATRRIARPDPPIPGEVHEHPTTRGTENALPPPVADGPAPAVPLPSGSSGVANWKRPAADGGDPPSTTKWRHPAITAALASPAGPALEQPTTRSWKRPALPPPAEPALDPTSAPPTATDAIRPVQRPTTSQWRRPLRTPPTIPPAGEPPP